MAKQKLFGNKSEARCETCAFGKPTGDGSVILCDRGGAVPAHHHCRRFRYDPLKRTPHRIKAQASFTAADFSLDDTDSWIDSTAGDAAVSQDERHTKLHTYLDKTVAPSAKEIIDLLSEEPTPAQPKQDVTPAVADSSPLIDNTPDIFGDLERLTVAKVSGSTKAAFEDFELQLDSGAEEDEPDLSQVTAMFDTTILTEPVLDEPDSDDNLSVLDDTPVLTLTADDDTDEDYALTADDLVFLSPEENSKDDDTELLTMSDDGTIVRHPAE